MISFEPLISVHVDGATDFHIFFTLLNSRHMISEIVCVKLGKNYFADCDKYL